jgi:hypothetical protein
MLCLNGQLRGNRYAGFIALALSLIIGNKVMVTSQRSGHAPGLLSTKVGNKAWWSRKSGGVHTYGMQS